MRKSKATRMLCGGISLLLTLYLILTVAADPPEFAQESDKPKAYRHLHRPNKWRELAWWILNPVEELNYDVEPHHVGGFKQALIRCLANTD